jgi:hypothetical protein
MEWIPREQNQVADKLAKEATGSHPKLWTMRYVEKEMQEMCPCFGECICATGQG